LLLNFFKQVDLVECTDKFLEQARNNVLKKEVEAGRVNEFFHVGLEIFSPEPQRYDLIWCQWVLNHLTDGNYRCVFITWLLNGR
jgi:protein N-terminal methyltransferase